MQGQRSVKDTIQLMNDESNAQIDAKLQIKDKQAFST
jgi:hypothetical protein